MSELNVLEDRDHMLGTLAEECGEIVQMLGKIQRFGFTDRFKGATNKERLELEVGQLLAVIDGLIFAEHLDIDRLTIARFEKPAKMQKWYRYAKEREQC